jgi:hypothetical protein
MAVGRSRVYFLPRWAAANIAAYVGAFAVLELPLRINLGYLLNLPRPDSLDWLLVPLHAAVLGAITGAALISMLKSVSDVASSSETVDGPSPSPSEGPAQIRGSGRAS